MKIFKLLSNEFSKRFNFIINESNLFRSKNIFESFRYCYYVNKLSGYMFFSIKKTSESYKFSSTKFDFFVFVSSLVLSLWSFYETLEISSVYFSKSVVLKLGFLLSAKLAALHSLILIFCNFINRKHLFKIIENFDWMDQKVE